MSETKTKAVKSKKTEVLWLKPEELIIQEGFNVRYDYGDLDELANSIAENGVKVPIRVYIDKETDQKIVIDGHRRYKAVQKLVAEGYEDFLVPVMVEPTYSNEESRVLGMVIFNEGKNLTMLEESRVYEKLRNFGWNATEISKKVGKSVTHIANCFKLLEAPKKVLLQIEAGTVSPSSVVEALKKDTGKNVQKKITSAVKKSGGAKVTPKHLSKNSQSRGENINLENLRQLQTSLEEIVEGDRKEDAFEALNNLIKWGDDSIPASELIKTFFTNSN